MTKERILRAAMAEFAAKGLDARIEDIAATAGANRRMAYFYFGSKERLYLAALERTYADLIEVEKTIDIETMAPVAAIDALVAAKFEHYIRFPHFVRFLNVENMYGARHLRKSKRLEEFRSPLINLISRVLDRGRKQGLFRADVDPLELYVSICALIYYVFSNQLTIGAMFKVDFATQQGLDRHRAFIVDLIVSYLRWSAQDAAALRAAYVVKP